MSAARGHKRAPVRLEAEQPPEHAQRGAPSVLSVTSHAVERYQERWRPDLSMMDADLDLAAEVRGARFAGMDGRQFMYRTPCGALLTVIQEWHDRSAGSVATVLPRGAHKTVYNPKKRRWRR